MSVFTNWNARTVIRRALIIAETLRKGDIPRFSLDGDIPYYDDVNPIEFYGDFENETEINEQLVTANKGDLAWNKETKTVYKFENNSLTNTNSWTNTNKKTYPLSRTAKILQEIETPEFQFTQSTLREILQGVGGFVHGEPRLDDGVIKYDFYGGTTVSDFNPTGYASKSYQNSIEQFATSLDSSVDNLVNSLGYSDGTLTEPYDGGFKTVRTENVTARLTSENMFIQTLYPIRAIKKLEVGLVGSPYNTTDSYDITAFVYESADYSRLSSFDSAYPLCKAYALYYTQGENNVYGLSFIRDTATDVGGLWAYYAIVNILNAVSDQSRTGIDFYQELAFRITYEPIFSARVGQSKMCLKGYDKPASLAYNQSQNLIETHYYGENLKGEIAGLGNDSLVLTYVKQNFDFSTLPKVGEVLNVSGIMEENEETDADWYITAVAVEIQALYVKFTVSVTKDFNNYSEYVGVNSNKRLFEISEKQAFDSHVSYKDYVVIGDAPPRGVTHNDTLIKIENSVLGIFYKIKGPNVPISCVQASGYDSNDNLINTVTLPVQTSAFGLTALFVFKYKDNYSAGDMVIKNNTNYYQNGVPYCDYFGNLEYLDLVYLPQGPVPAKELTREEKLKEQTDIGLNFPSVETILPKYYMYTEDYIWIKKGSTEIPTINYEVDFVTNRSDIIIGSALVKSLPLITKKSESGEVKAVWLSSKINKFQKFINPDDANHNLKISCSFDDTVSTISVTITNSDTSVSRDGWAIINENTNEILIASNRSLTESVSFTIFTIHDFFKTQNIT